MNVLNAKLINLVVGLIGAMLILVGVLIGTERIIAIILLSIGTSIFASAIVTGLNSRYLLEKSNAARLVEQWGIEQVYETRAEINAETNELLKTTKELDICAMGLKGFRDAQGDLIKSRIAAGMILHILTLSPTCDYLARIDEEEGLVEGSTKASIESLLRWVDELKKTQLNDNQICIRFYNNYPYDFYFCLDGVVFTGPYQPKTSQQTITYKYCAHSHGAQLFRNYFNMLWEKKGYDI